MLILLIFIFAGLLEIGIIASVFIPYFRYKAYKDIEQETLLSKNDKKNSSENFPKSDESDDENSASKKNPQYIVEIFLRGFRILRFSGDDLRCLSNISN